MTTVSDILHYLDTVAPGYMQEDWDKAGLNCGHLESPVTKILVALDPFDSVCKEAKELGAELLITHHPLLWESGFITDQSAQGENTLFLIENKIAHICAHTNLDCAPGGVNDTLAYKLGLQDIQVIAPKGTDANGEPWGLLRQGAVSSQELDDFLRHVKKSLGCEGLRYVDGSKRVCRVAVGGGACASELAQAKEAGCDTFVTADCKYNHFFDAKYWGINLIDAGHFYTENPVVSVLAHKLRQAFPNIIVEISQNHRDCAKFFL